MESALTIHSPRFNPFKHLSPPLSLSKTTTTTLRPPFRSFPIIKKSAAIRAAHSNDAVPSPKPQNPLFLHLKSAASATIFAAVVFAKFPHSPAKAEIPPPPATSSTEEIQQQPDDSAQYDKAEQTDEKSPKSPLTHLLESNSEAIEALKTLLKAELEAGEDEQALTTLTKLSSAQPENTEWKFLMARLLNEMGRVEQAHDVYKQILLKTPLSFEALFENALLMDRSGARDAVMSSLKDALKIAEEEKKAKEARDVKLIIAQMQFLQKKVDEALKSYDELVKEDPSDFRPYFCKGMIYSLLDKNKEAKEQFAKCRELSPKKFEVEGYLRSPLSRMKLFGTDEEN